MIFLAYIFRSVNAYLIDELPWIIHKFLKVFKRLTDVIYMKSRTSSSNIVTINNFDKTISLKLDTSATIAGAIYWTGFHELREIMFLHRFLKPNMVFVDIGANLGEYTLFAAKRLLHGKVLAYEPAKKMYQVLTENISLNHFKNIITFQVGLSNEVASLPLYNAVSGNANEGLSTLYPSNTSTEVTEYISLQVFDDEFEKLNLTRLDFIKMDIEGAELSALRGSENVLKKFKPLVLVEINESSYHAAGYTIEDISSYFNQLGYKPYSISKDGALNPVSTLPPFANIVFKPI